MRTLILMLGTLVVGGATVLAQAPAPVVIPTPDLSGRWSGTWEDCKSGHHGPLKANFSRCDDQHYRVTFTGRFFAVIPFRYSVVLNVVGQEGDKVILAGENRVPLFGTFTYRAEATCTCFVAHFDSCRYQGTFRLSRCCP